MQCLTKQICGDHSFSQVTCKVSTTPGKCIHKKTYPWPQLNLLLTAR